MKNNKVLEGLGKRADKFQYTGKLEDFQLHGAQVNGKKYISYEAGPFNEYQNFLYKRALMGLKIYSPEELSSMKEDKKARIKKIYSKTQKVLNVYKQEVVNRLTNNIFTKLFPTSPVTQALVNELTFTDSDFVNTLNFKVLNISKSDIIEQLINNRILPKNFYELKGVSLHD